MISQVQLVTTITRTRDPSHSAPIILICPPKGQFLNSTQILRIIPVTGDVYCDIYYEGFIGPHPNTRLCGAYARSSDNFTSPPVRYSEIIVLPDPVSQTNTTCVFLNPNRTRYFPVSSVNNHGFQLNLEYLPSGSPPLLSSDFWVFLVYNNSLKTIKSSFTNPNTSLFEYDRINDIAVDQQIRVGGFNYQFSFSEENYRAFHSSGNISRYSLTPRGFSVKGTDTKHISFFIFWDKQGTIYYNEVFPVSLLGLCAIVGFSAVSISTASHAVADEPLMALYTPDQKNAIT